MLPVLLLLAAYLAAVFSGHWLVASAIAAALLARCWFVNAPVWRRWWPL